MEPNRSVVLVSLIVIAFAQFALVPNDSSAQYIYVDLNGDGINNSDDVLPATGSATLSIWLRTNADRDGSPAFCPTANGPMTLRSYQIVLRLDGGTVNWGTFTNKISEFTTFLGSASSPDEFLVGYAGTADLPPGTYFLGTVSASIATDNPDIRFSAASSFGPGIGTEFGAACGGNDADHLLKLESDWYDADGVRSITRWVPDGFDVARTPGEQSATATTGDGAGSTITVWQDFGNGLAWDIFAQKVSNLGPTLWPAGGVPVSISLGDQGSPRIVPDSSGGAIIAWRDSRSGNDDIYAQRLSTNGSVVWDSSGVAVCTAPGNQESARMISDGAGGVIIAWEDRRASPSAIFAQRVNTAGVARWGTNGIQLATAVNSQQNPEMIGEGSGGAIISWADFRFDPSTPDIFAQRVDSSGTKLWQPDGMPVVVFPAGQQRAAMTPDGSGGAVIAWQDNRGGAGYDIYAQRISAIGLPQWSASGVLVSSAANDQEQPVAVTDAAGGAIVFWSDYRNCFQCGDIYAQRVTGISGALAWADSGVAICTAVGAQLNFRAIPDGGGAAIIAWDDTRSDAGDIYTQRVTGSGGVLWGADALGVCTATGSQAAPSITSDGNFGAVITWQDRRDNLSYDPYIMRVTLQGTGVEASQMLRRVPALAQNHPNPFNPITRIGYFLPARTRVRLEVFDIRGGLVARLIDREIPAGQHQVTWSGRDDRGRPAASGVYYYRLDAAGLVASRRMVLVR